MGNPTQVTLANKYRKMLEADRETTSVRPLLLDKTIQQVADTLGKLESEFGYGIKVRAEATTVNDDFPSGVMAAVRNIIFPRSAESMSDLILLLAPEAMNVASTRTPVINHGGFNVNSTVLRETKDVIESAMDISSTIIHEYEHAIQMLNPGLNLRAMITGIKHSENIRKDVSDYAQSDPYEFGAEAFLEAETDPDNTPLWVKEFDTVVHRYTL